MEILLNFSRSAKFSKEMAEYKKKLPKFPDGRLDYSQSPIAPVVSCFLEFDGKILLLKRSSDVGFYPGLWGVITGFLDRSESDVVETAMKELKEELGVSREEISNLYLGIPYKLKDKAVEKNRTWVIYPVLVKLKRKPKITLDWENDKYIWIKASELDKYETLPGLSRSLSRVLKYI